MPGLSVSHTHTGMCGLTGLGVSTMDCRPRPWHASALRRVTGRSTHTGSCLFLDSDLLLLHTRMTQAALPDPSWAQEPAAAAEALPAGWVGRERDGWGQGAQLGFCACAYGCTLFPNILVFPISQKNGWKMNCSKQQGLHKCQRVVTKTETLRWDKGSGDRTSAGGEQRWKLSWNAGNLSSLLSKVWCSEK